MIQFQHVSKSYNHHALVVEDLNLEVKRGEMLVLLCESGCGKDDDVENGEPSY